MVDVNVRLDEDQSVRLKMKDVGDGTHALPVYSSAELSAAGGTDRSITASTTSQLLMPANTARRRFYVKNDSTIDVWLNPVSPAAASAGAGNIKVPANGGYFELENSTSAWYIIAVSGSPAITAREF
jgi:hypothetical protein